MGARHAVFGGEGQYYMGPFTFYGQLGYDTTLHRTVCGNVCAEDPVDVNAWFVRATGRYYYTPNIRFEGTVLYADGELDPFTTARASTRPSPLGCGRPRPNGRWTTIPSHSSSSTGARGPITRIVASASFCNFDVKVTDNRFLVGARMYLGEGTLLWNDRKGTTLDIIAPLAIQSGPLYADASAANGESDSRSADFQGPPTRGRPFSLGVPGASASARPLVALLPQPGQN